MLTNSSIRLRIVFWLLIHSLIEVNCQLTPFKPLRRDSHTATFINDKLYILGGKLDNANNVTIGKQFFYLDVSATFNTQGLPWYDLTDINQVPPHDAAASVNGGANNETLFLYGGNDENDNDKTPLVYAFDTQSNSWDVPKMTDDAAITRKFDLTGIVGDNRKMYLFGGDHIGGDVNDMLILDTINLSWGKGSSTNAPTPREVYGATMIPNQRILYLGGFNDNSKGSLSLAEVYLYDTINDNWSTKSTTGTIPSNRDSFSVVLGLDGQRIIIFGGSGENQGASLSPQDSLYVMDLTDYRWYVPKVSGDLPSSRHWHRSNVIGRYMIVSFGIGYDEDESDVLLLDISNNDEYTWTDAFDPALPTTSTTSVPNSSTNSTPNHRNKHRKSVIIGAVVGSLIVSVSLLLGGFFIYKMNKIKRKKNNPYDGYDGYFEDLTIPAVISDRKKEVISTTRTIDDYVHERKPSRAGNRREAMILNVDHKQKPLRGKETLTTDDEVYDDEREVTPRDDPNSSSSSPNINDVLERFKDELLQAFRQEVTQRSQVNQQVLTANDLENYKSEIDQAVRRQSMRQDFNINHLENYKHEILYAVMDEVIQKFKIRSNKI